jgi:hypothetical protein
MSVEKKNRFALLGTITSDTITRSKGRSFSGLGGILYQAAALCGLGKDVSLYTCLGRELKPQADRITAGWPTCHAERIEVVEGPGNRVFLHYPEEGERVEILKSPVPPLDPSRVLEEIPAHGMLIQVINSGFDIRLRDWRRVVERARCPVWFDVHSLALSLELGVPRRYRKVPEWKEWVEGVTYLQANKKEVAAILGSPEVAPTQERLEYFGRAAQALGIRAIFITLGAEGVWMMTPQLSRKFSPPQIAGVVDTTGCGDVFCSAAAARLASGSALLEAAAFGVELASAAARVAGVEATYELVSRTRPIRGPDT